MELRRGGLKIELMGLLLDCLREMKGRKDIGIRVSGFATDQLCNFVPTIYPFKFQFSYESVFPEKGKQQVIYICTEKD